MEKEPFRHREGSPRFVKKKFLEVKKRTSDRGKIGRVIMGCEDVQCDPCRKKKKVMTEGRRGKNGSFPLILEKEMIEEQKA